MRRRQESIGWKIIPGQDAIRTHRNDRYKDRGEAIEAYGGPIPIPSPKGSPRLSCDEIEADGSKQEHQPGDNIKHPIVFDEDGWDCEDRDEDE